MARLCLSLKQHPIALVRPFLSARKVITAAELQETPAPRCVSVAGLVLIRQRPQTASGIVFVTLEDETGVVNLILRPDIYDRSHAAARHASLLHCDGPIERQGQVIHIRAKKLHDLSGLLIGQTPRSRDFH